MSGINGSPILERLGEELRGGDDVELWSLLVRRVAGDAAKLFDIAVAAPRHLFLTFARVRGGGAHPDDHPTFSLSWERSRGEPDWSFAGPNPRLLRKRGFYTATACIPIGTARLAYVDAVVLWRPRLPWATPEDTEIGRQIYRFRREPDSSWRCLGARES